MNTRLLSQEVQTFITQSLHCNLSQLILKGSPFEDVSIQEIAQQIEGKQKSLKKQGKRINYYWLVALNGGCGLDLTINATMFLT